MWKNHKGYISPSRDKVLKNLKGSSFIIFTAALIVSGFFVSSVLAAHTATVSVTPQYVAGGSINTYTYTVTNDAGSTHNIVEIDITVPSGFTFGGIGTVTCPFSWAKTVIDSQVRCVRSSGQTKLTPGNSAVMSFSATAPTPESDTSYVWNVRTWDDNDASYDSSASTVVDVTPPTTTDNAPGAGNWQATKPITVTLTCTDVSSGCAATYYCVDQANTCNPTTPGTSVSVSTEGKNYVRYYSVDNVGNTEGVKSAQVWIDTIAPTATIVINGNADYTNSLSVTLTLTYSDETSGVDKCRYKNEVGDWIEWETCTNTKGWTLTSGDGEKTVYYEVRDVAGNVGSNSNSIILDTTPPVVGSLTVTPTIGIYTSPNPTITATITDTGGSGVASCKYQLTTGGEWGEWYDASWNSNTNTCTANPTGLADGSTYQFNIKGIDNAGNEGEGTQVERTVDATPPTISNAKLEPLVEGSGLYGKGTLTASADVSDAVAGVKSVRFTIINDADSTKLKYCDGSLVSGNDKSGRWSCEINTLEPLPDGKYDFKVEAQDKANNPAESSFDKLFTLDNTPPTTDKNVGNPHYYVAGQNGGPPAYFVTTQTQFTLTPTDTGIGPDKTWFRIFLYNETCGNPENEQCWNVKIWTDTDGDGVIDSSELAIGPQFPTDKGWILYTNSFVIPQESMHAIEFYSIDKLGNEEQHRMEVDIVDNSPPETTKSYGTPFYTDGTNKWITSNTTITLNAVDCGNADNCALHPVGVKETKYRFYPCDTPEGQKPPFTTYSGAFKIPQESCHVIEYYSVDFLGNTEIVKSQQVYVENTPPVLTKEVGKPKFPPIDVEEVGNGNVEWSTEKVHSGSHSAKLYVSDGSKDWAGVDIEVDIALKDITELSFWEYIASYAPNGWDVNVILGIDADKDGDFEADLAGWHIGPDAWTLQALKGDTFVEMDGALGGNPATGVWTQINALPVSQWWTPDKSGAGFAKSNTYPWTFYSTFSNLINVFIPDPTQTSLIPDVNARVKLIKLLIGGSGSWKNEIAFVDDLSLNGNIIMSEPPNWITQNTPITLSCYDPEPHPSDNVKIWYRYFVDGQLKQDWIQYTQSITFSEDSAHALEYKCEDALGNSDGVHTQTYFVDTASPNTTKTVGSPSSENGYWIRTNTLITLTATDSQLHPVGVKETKYRYYLCGQTPGGWQTYTAPFSIPEESCHKLEYFSVDLLGNTETAKVQEHNVDNTAPTATITDIVGTTYQNDYYVKGTINIKGTATDNKCFANYKVEYQKTGETTWTQIGSGTSQVDNDLLATWNTATVSDGTYKLKLTAEDCVGNSAESFFDVFVDNTAPISQTNSPETATAGANEVQVSFSVCWNGNDAGSGIEKFNLWVKDGKSIAKPWVDWTTSTWAGCADYRGTIGHTYCFKSRAKDYLGNYEKDKEVGDKGVSCTDVVAFTYKIPLVQGWNLISLPVVPIDRDTEDVLGDIALGTKGVWAYDPTNPDAVYGWLTYAAEDVPSNLTTMTAGYGYWIDMANNDTLAVAGTIMPVGGGITPPQRTLIPGWNLVGHYGVYDKYTCQGLYSLVNTQSMSARWSMIYNYNAEEGRFYSVDTCDYMKPGYGYWILISSGLPENMVYGPSENYDYCWYYCGY